MYVHVYVCVYIYIYIYMCIYIYIYTHVCMCIYIYICIMLVLPRVSLPGGIFVSQTPGEAPWHSLTADTPDVTANLRSKILDVRGFDSSIILSLRGGTLMFTGNFPEGSSQAILAGIILVLPNFTLRIVRPRIFESKFRNHCAKKLDGALRKPTSFV